MTWVLLEGLDRTGKSTVAELYRSQGFDVIHFSAPAKKYTTPGYTGPSYLEDILSMLVSLTGKDVVFDRSWMGEQVWPFVYGRNALLSTEDLDVIREIEDQNQTVRILMHDPDARAHWQRCVENKEPLDGVQFKTARDLFYKMAETYGFTLKTKHDVHSAGETDNMPQRELGVSQPAGVSNDVREALSASNQIHNNIERTENTKVDKGIASNFPLLTPEQKRLAEANAINDVLSKPIVKLKGEHYSSIEAKIRSFLNQELSALLGTSVQVQSNGLTAEEIQIFRALIKRSSK